MIRRQTLCYCLIFSFIALSGCKKETDKPPTSSEVAVESNRLYSFFNREFNGDLKESPMLQTQLGIKDDYGAWDNYSHLRYATDLEKAKRRLTYLKDSIDPKILSEEARMSYQLYREKLENEIEDYPFRLYNYPVNQLAGIQSQLPAFLIHMHQVDSVEDAEAYLSRLRAIPRVIEDVIKEMELREMNQVLPPKFVFTHTLKASKNIISGKPFEKSVSSSPLLADFKGKVESLNIKAEKKKALVLEMQEVLLESIKPAYEKLIAKLEDQNQRATQEVGVWKFPKGKKYYRLVLNRMTTTDLSPEEIHEKGLQEVARVHHEMEALMKKTGFKGSLQDFFKFLREDEQFYYENTPDGREQYLDRVRGVIDTLYGALDQLFTRKPQAELVVKPVEPFLQENAPKAFYQVPALDDSRPGRYYVNLQDMGAMPSYQLEALTYHGAIPGHHLQRALAQEFEGLPMFRRLSAYPAYEEGWAMYSEVLPRELGLYQDPYADIGRLAMELWRSIHLVVDTGIHAKKWTREEAIEYYLANAPIHERDAIKMVERHIVFPGQATTFKIGMMKIQELRGRAEKELGKEFDPRVFHEVILRDGSVPLWVLEQNVEQWIKRTKTR